MIRRDIAATYKTMSDEDRRTFDRWLKANLVVGAVFAGAFLVMVLASSGALGPGAAIADNNAPAGRASGEGAIPGRPMSAFDLTIRIRPEALPVERVDEPF